MFTDTENDNLRTADNPSIRLNRDHQESAHASHADTTGDYGHPESAHASHADTAGDSGHINEQHGETRNERSEAERSNPPTDGSEALQLESGVLTAKLQFLSSVGRRTCNGSNKMENMPFPFVVELETTLPPN
ncbi:hypothetical protein V6N11_049568 [Hibiscus sabdariffa]|uniref:Uncharacterized protein n=1 Tax=Hibiscus sabdariffa TaxID=183260 RepID=A0ABR2NMN6_9ROSI